LRSPGPSGMPLSRSQARLSSIPRPPHRIGGQRQRDWRPARSVSTAATPSMPASTRMTPSMSGQVSECSRSPVARILAIPACLVGTRWGRCLPEHICVVSMSFAKGQFRRRLAASPERCPGRWPVACRARPDGSTLDQRRGSQDGREDARASVTRHTGVIRDSPGVGKSSEPNAGQTAGLVPPSGLGGRPVQGGEIRSTCHAAVRPTRTSSCTGGR
jgi:hypothetical protein